ncbi:MAG: response regulator [Phycisphaeraceae bacterium]|nr:response regulator [Phycisphaeraceae bacterium]
MIRDNFDASKFTVLCVDDELGVRQAVHRAIRPLGLHVIKAEDGESGIAMLMDETVHVLICDAAMPGMGGIEMMRQATVIAPGVPRILLTGHANTEDVVVPAINDCAIFRIVPKPWNPLALQHAVIEALGFTESEWEQLVKASKDKDQTDAA